jgi:hypothetical protein
MEPLLVLTVTFKVPDAALGATESRTCCELEPVMEKLLGVAVTPAGRLVSVQETVPEKLFTPNTLTVTVPPP